MPLLISVIGFIVIMLIFTMMYNDYFSDKIAITERVEKYVQDRPTEIYDLNSQSLAAVPSDEFWRQTLSNLSEPLKTTHWAKTIERKLAQADLPVRGSEFILIILSLMLLVMTLFLLLSGGKLLMGIIGLIIGYFMPIIFINLKISRRIKNFNAQLADALVLVASSLRSGYSFMQAIEMVSREMPPPMSIEFYRVLREINLGVTTDAAMNHMAQRINSEDLDLVVTAVLIQRQIGGNLAEILDNIAYTIRERVKIKGHISTLTAQGRMSGVIVCLLPVFICIVVYVINPQFMLPLFTQPIGQAMLLAGIVMEIIGGLLIRNIVNIRV